MPELKDSIKVGSLTLKNRIIGAPMVMQWIDPQTNLFTEEAFQMYKERAEGGVAMLIVEATAVEKGGVIIGEPHPVFDSEDKIPHFAKMAEVIRKAGALPAIQIMHAGRFGIDPVAPSNTPAYGLYPRVLTTDDCKRLVDRHIKLAGWCKKAGYDAVQIHCAHGWLYQLFMSPYTNHRDDEYGEDRMKFVTDIIKGIKEECGNDYAVLVRISGDEYIGDKGITLDMTVNEIVPALEAAGVDSIDVSAATLEPYRQHWFVQPVYQPRGVIIHLAEAVKKTAKIPVSGVGRINDLRLAEKYVKEGIVDMVTIGRLNLVAPDAPKKYFMGLDKENIRCLACDWCFPRSQRSYCAGNPFLGKTDKISLEPVPKNERKNVVVIGAGPAGLYSAYVAGKRGHNVIVLEKRNRIGGTLWHASFIPRVYTRELYNIINWLEDQVSELSNVEIRLNSEATPSLISELSPDFLIIAVGADNYIPDGVKFSKIFAPEDYIEGKVDIKDKSVAIAGVIYGAEVALSCKRCDAREVILVESTPAMWAEGVPYFIIADHRRGNGYMATPRVRMLAEMLIESGVKILDSAQIESVEDRKVIINKDGKKIEEEIDVIIWGEKRVPRNFEEFTRLEIPYKAVGDCAEGGKEYLKNIIKATHEGAEVAISI